MRKRFIVGLTGAMLLLAQSLPASAADHAATLVEECGKQLNLGPAGCACIGKRAGETLNDKQRQLVVAMVTQDQAASTKVRNQMTMEEITGAASFMMNAPKHCAQQ